jgi:hypothetical protein
MERNGIVPVDVKRRGFKNTLQCIPCSGSRPGSQLTLHPDVDCIVSTVERTRAMIKDTPMV